VTVIDGSSALRAARTSVGAGTASVAAFGGAVGGTVGCAVRGVGAAGGSGAAARLVVASGAAMSGSGSGRVGGQRSSGPGRGARLHRRPQRGDEVRAGGEPPLGLLRGGAGHGGVHRGREVGSVQARPGRIGREVGVDHRRRLGTGVGHLTGQRAEGEAGQAVLVGAAIDPPALDLLRRRVVHRAHVLPRRRELAPARGRLGDAEVAQVHGPAAGTGDQDVAGLDVAVHQTRGVHGVEGVGHRLQQGAQRLDVEPTVALEHRAEVLAVDEAHRQVEHAVRVARVVDRDDVRVLQAGRDGGLPLEAVAVLPVGGERRGEHLEGDRAAQLEVAGAVDDAHTAFADEGVDAVARQHAPDPSRDGCALLLRHRQSGC
jgi:hypothetical protein